LGCGGGGVGSGGAIGVGGTGTGGGLGSGGGGTGGGLGATGVGAGCSTRICTVAAGTGGCGLGRRVMAMTRMASIASAIKKARPNRSGSDVREAGG
jgi:hypothetical protein